MNEKSIAVDMELWGDPIIWQKQNRLKEGFWSILGNISNSIPEGTLTQIHPKHKGKKLSKGNDLKGFPYQVLDLIRDFELARGINIRVLNWFGNGLFIFVLIGKQNNHASKHQDFIFDEYKLGLTPSPWSYPELIEQQCFTLNPTHTELEKLEFYHWFKQIELRGDQTEIEEKITTQLKKVLNFLV